MTEDGRSDNEAASRPSGSDRVRYRHDRRESTFSLPAFLGSLVILLTLVSVVIFLTLRPGEDAPPASPAPEPAGTSGSVAAEATAEATGLVAEAQRSEQRIRKREGQGSETGEMTEPESGEPLTEQLSPPLVGEEEAEAASVPAGDSVVRPAYKNDRGEPPGGVREPGTARDRSSLSGQRGVETASAIEHWWLGPVGVRADLFLLDRSDESGERHRFAAAAPGERFVFLEFTIAWRGKNSRECVIRPVGEKQPTIRLLGGPRRFDPLGLLTSEAEPLQPLGPASVKVQPHEQVTMHLVFVVPEDLKEVDLSTEGLRNLKLALPPAQRLEVGSLVGRWRRVDELYRPMRSDSALIDAIGRPAGQIAQISLGGRASLRLELPGAGITGSGTEAQPSADGGGGAGASTSISVTLQREDERQPCVLRATKESHVLLLYAGDSPQTVFVYQRSDL